MNTSITFSGHADEIRHEMLTFLGLKAVPFTAPPAAPAQDPAVGAAEQTATEITAPPTDQPETGEKPSVYRAKNAANIANAIIDKLKSGADMDENDLDDLPRLPKKWQKEIMATEAEMQAKAAPEGDSTEPDADNDDGPTFIVYNDDSTELSEHATPAEWVEAMVERLGDVGSMKELEAIGQANRSSVEALLKLVSSEDLAPVTQAYSEQSAKFAPSEETPEKESESADETADSEAPQSDPPADSNAEPSLDDTMAVAKKVLGKLGMPATEALLSRFDATKVSDIKPGKRADFIAEAQNQLEALA